MLERLCTGEEPVCVGVYSYRPSRLTNSVAWAAVSVGYLVLLLSLFRWATVEGRFLRLLLGLFRVIGSGPRASRSAKKNTRLDSRVSEAQYRMNAGGAPSLSVVEPNAEMNIVEMNLANAVFVIDIVPSTTKPSIRDIYAAI